MQLTDEQRNRYAERIRSYIPSIAHLFDPMNISCGIISDNDIVKTMLLHKQYSETGYTYNLNQWIRELKEIEEMKYKELYSMQIIKT